MGIKVTFNMVLDTIVTSLLPLQILPTTPVYPPAVP